MSEYTQAKRLAEANLKLMRSRIRLTICVALATVVVGSAIAWTNAKIPEGTYSLLLVYMIIGSVYIALLAAGVTVANWLYYQADKKKYRLQFVPSVNNSEGA